MESLGTRRGPAHGHGAGQVAPPSAPGRAFVAGYKHGGAEQRCRAGLGTGGSTEMYRSRGTAGVPLGTVRGLLCFCATLAGLVGWGNPLSILTLPPLAIPPLNLPPLRSPPGPFH